MSVCPPCVSGPAEGTENENRQDVPLSGHLPPNGRGNALICQQQAPTERTENHQRHGWGHGPGLQERVSEWKRPQNCPSQQKPHTGQGSTASSPPSASSALTQQRATVGPSSRWGSRFLRLLSLPATSSFHHPDSPAEAGSSPALWMPPGLRDGRHPPGPRPLPGVGDRPLRTQVTHHSRQTQGSQLPHNRHGPEGSQLAISKPGTLLSTCTPGTRAHLS